MNRKGALNSTVHVVSTDKSKDGHNLITVTIGDNKTTKYVLDQHLKYSPIRIDMYRPSGILKAEFDVTNARDPLGGWWPSQWTIRALLDGTKTPTVIEACNVSFAKLNLNYPDTEFTIAFPAGTIVVDSRPPQKPVDTP